MVFFVRIAISDVTAGIRPGLEDHPVVIQYVQIGVTAPKRRAKRFLRWTRIPGKKRPQRRPMNADAPLTGNWMVRPSAKIAIR